MRRQPRQVFPSDVVAMTDEQLRRFVAQAAGLLGARQGDYETAVQLRRIADALLESPRAVSAKQDSLLRHLAESGLTIREAADALGESYGAARARAKRLGIRFGCHPDKIRRGMHQARRAPQPEAT